MIIICDSGSTKSDWSLIDGGETKARIATQGINPFFMSRDEMLHIAREELDEASEGRHELRDAEAVFFYGSGCREEMIPAVCDVLKEAFPHAKTVEAASDMLGAARAVCGDKEGIACILGTGSNSCLYDGRQICSNVPPMGFILGDEGSGAVLGKRFVNAVYKGGVSDEIRAAFEEETQLSLAEIIEHVYRKPLPNRFLASLSPFIKRHVMDADVHRIVVENFRDFFRKNVANYGKRELEVGAIGSIAWNYAEELREAAALEGFKMGRIEQSPMQGLIEYHKVKM